MAAPFCDLSFYLFHRWEANLRILEIDEIKKIPDVPLSHPFVERLIGSLGRELFDQVLFWTSSDLKRKLTDYQNYYNEHHVHTSLHGVTPMNKAGRTTTSSANFHNYQWQSHCRGLVQLPMVV